MKRKIIGILVVTLLLYASFLPAAEIIDNYEQNYLNETEFSNYPDDFELMAYSVSIDTWETNYKLEINNQGLTKYYCMYPEDREQLKWTLLNEFTIPSNSMDELWNEILDNDFFNLDSLYKSPIHELGGGYAKLTITGEAKFPIKFKIPRISRIFTSAIPMKSHGMASVKNHRTRIHNFLNSAFNDGLLYGGISSSISGLSPLISKFIITPASM